MRLWWQTPSQSSPEIVPQTALSPAGDSGFIAEDVEAVQVKLSNMDGPDRQKVGLVIRPLEADHCSATSPDLLAEQGYWDFDDALGATTV